MKTLITGGAGFIGSHTADLFLKAGHEVTVYDDFSTGKEANLAAVRDRLQIVNADILDLEWLTAACEGVEAVVHLAAISSVAKSIQEPVRTHSVNATGTLHVLEAAHQAGVRRVVFASSAAIYGDDPELPKRESSPAQPQSPYAWHKLTGEFYGETYRRLHGLEFAALRYFNVYGPRQDPMSPYSGVLSIFVQRVLAGSPLPVHGDGLQTRDFIHVSDVARVNLQAVEIGQAPPAMMCIGTGRETTVLDAAAMIAGAGGGPEATIQHGEPRAGDIRRSYADPALLREAYGIEAAMPIETGLRELVDFVRKSPPAP